MALFSLPGCLTALAAILTFSVWRILYNLYFHPLSRFPGPKLAACSRLWLAYRELIRGESLGDLRVELHRQYGARKTIQAVTSIDILLSLGEVVRLTPNEVRPSQLNALFSPL